MAPERRPTYDDIIARTVPDPDSSFRPTPEQQRATRAGVVLPDAEEALAGDVASALDAAGYGDISVEVEGARVVLRGAVADTYALHQIEAVASAVEGVREIDNRLHIGRSR